MANGKNPRDVKILLAKESSLVSIMKQAAEAAEQEFINRFQKGAMPDEMPEFTFEGEIGLATLVKRKQDWFLLLLKRFAQQNKVV